MARPAPSHRSPVSLRILLIVLASAALVAGAALWQGSSGRASPAAAPGALGPEGVPVPDAPPLAAPAAPARGTSVDGISCASTEQVAYHIHAHLAIFVRGAQRGVPAGIGIAPPRQIEATAHGPFVAGGGCFSWLHTHAADGIIHIESPTRRTYTLGELFDIWKQPLEANQVGPARGRVTALVDGRRYLGNPRAIPLRAHARIQLDVGRPVIASTSIRFPAGL